MIALVPAVNACAHAEGSTAEEDDEVSLDRKVAADRMKNTPYNAPEVPPMLLCNTRPIASNMLATLSRGMDTVPSPDDVDCCNACCSAVHPRFKVMPKSPSPGNDNDL